MARCYWQSALGTLAWPGIFIGHCTAWPVKSFVSQECLIHLHQHAGLSLSREFVSSPGDSAAPFVLLLCAGPPLMLPLSQEESAVLHAAGVKTLLTQAAAPHGVLAENTRLAARAS